MTDEAYRPLAKRRTLGEEIHDVLRERVLSGDLSAGDQLPSEKQLAHSFQVSRTVIREAISRLRVDGLVQTRQGIGAFVVPPSSSADAPDAPNLDPSARTPFVFELRWIMEPETTALAARWRTPAQLALIERRLDELGDALGRDGGPEADASFHESIAAASGNPLFEQIFKFIHQALRRSLTVSHRAVAGVDGGPDKLLLEHAAIVDAIRAKDEAFARQAAREHLLRASGRLSIVLR